MSDLERRSQIELSIDRLMRRDLITRRTFMGRAGQGRPGGRRAASPCPACWPPARRRPGGSADGSKLAWLNWPAYIDISEDETSYPSIEAFTEQTGHRSRVRRGPARQRRLPRAVRARPAGRQQHRLGRHVSRRLGGRAHGPPRLARGARPLEAAQLDRQRGRLRQGPLVRPGQQVQRLVAGRHHRHRATTRS